MIDSSTTLYSAQNDSFKAEVMHPTSHIERSEAKSKYLIWIRIRINDTSSPPKAELPLKCGRASQPKIYAITLASKVIAKLTVGLRPTDQTKMSLRSILSVLNNRIRFSYYLLPTLALPLRGGVWVRC